MSLLPISPPQISGEGRKTVEMKLGVSGQRLLHQLTGLADGFSAGVCWVGTNHPAQLLPSNYDTQAETALSLAALKLSYR